MVLKVKTPSPTPMEFGNQGNPEAVRQIRSVLTSLWEPLSGSPVSLARTISHLKGTDLNADPFSRLDDFDKSNLFNARGNLIADLQQVSFCESPIMLNGPELRTLRESLVRNQVDGLRSSIQVCKTGVDLLFRHAVKNGANPQELWDWSPDRDASSDPSIRSWGESFLPTWKEHLPEYLDGGKLPTLRMVYDLMRQALEKN